ncbi:MAG: glycosyltransferase family 39 protein [Candidatus Sumerlaeia bacterium]
MTHKGSSRKRQGRRAGPAEEAAAPGAQRLDAAAPCALCILAILVFYPVMKCLFVWDDVVAVLDNILLRTPGGAWKIWTTIGTIPAEKHYWPITYTLLWAQWQLWGNAPEGYHIVSVALNAAVALQVWRLMRRLGLPGAFLAAAVFAVHPVHVEVVAWVISQKDLLATLFFLIAVEMHANHDERGGWKWLALAAGAAIAAMLSKSSPVVLPAALAIWAWYRHGRIDRRNGIGIAVIGAVMLIMAVADMGVGAALAKAELATPPLAERIAASGWNFWRYALKLVCPLWLSPVYPRVAVDPGNMLHWLPLASIAAVTAGLWAARRRIGRGPLACWLFYGVALGPILGIIHFKFLEISQVADRYQYMASLGPVAGASVLIAAWSRRLSRAQAAWLYAAAGAVVLLFSGLSWRQAAIFRSQRTLFAHAITIAPDSPYVLWYLGTEELNDGKNELAERMFVKAVKIKPDLWGAVSNYGVSLIRQNRIREAASVLRRAVDQGSVESGVLSNLAWLMASQADPQVRNPAMALKLATQLVENAQIVTPAYLNTLAAAYAANGRFADAVVNLRKAISLARDYNEHKYADNLEKLILPAYESGRPMRLKSFQQDGGNRR